MKLETVEEGSVIFEDNAVSELIENLFEQVDVLTEHGVHRYVKPADVFEPSPPRSTRCTLEYP
jgi:hypothetical protein